MTAKVAIVGAGIGGLSAAQLLANRGLDVVVIGRPVQGRKSHRPILHVQICASFNKQADDVELSLEGRLAKRSPPRPFFWRGVVIDVRAAIEQVLHLGDIARLGRFEQVV